MISIANRLAPRYRFFAILLPRLGFGQCSDTRLIAYADELHRTGSPRLSRWCLGRVVRSNAVDKGRCDALIGHCLKEGRYTAAEAIANGHFDVNGMHPNTAMRFVAELAHSGGLAGASRLFERLLRRCGDDIGLASPSPARRHTITGAEVQVAFANRTQAPERAGSRRELFLLLARLCFSFGVHDVCVKLYDCAGGPASDDCEDKVTYAAALLLSGQLEQAADGHSHIDLPAETEWASLNTDWRLLLASMRFAAGDYDAARTLVASVIEEQFRHHEDVEQVVKDCVDIVSVLSNCPDELIFDRNGWTGELATRKTGLRKIFVCGSGWSGSGALYDALIEYDGLAVAPDTPLDRYLNDGTENEMTFVQGPAGLGHLWRAARDTGSVTRIELWHAFRLHVLAGGPIGFSEHKAARVARNLRSVYGHAYTTVFLHLITRASTMHQPIPLDRWRDMLMEATEALSGLFVGRGSETAGSEVPATVLYNNAIFGPAIDMLEIFGNASAAVVVRDPLDQFADRRARDFKQWMSARRYVTHHRDARRAFALGNSKLRASLAEKVREVGFEQFVLDEEYRRHVIDWLLGAASHNRVRRHFEPERSTLNVGIHARLLSADESAMLDANLAEWRPPK